MSIYVGDKKALLLKSDNSVVEFYKGDKKLFGYDGKESGTIVSVNDVTPIEHNVGVKVASKNLFDSNAFISLPDNNIYYGINKNGEIYIKQNDYRADTEIPACITLEAGTYTISSTVALTTNIKLINVTDKTVIAYALNKTFTLTKNTEIGIKAWSGADTVLGIVQIELGTTATEPTPYISNFAGGENLIPYPYPDTTQTIGGITFTDNGDGSITMNGTVTTEEVPYFNLMETKVFPKGNYIISGNSTNGDMVMFLYGAYGSVSTIVQKNGTDATFSLTEDTEVNISFYAEEGASYNNVTITPQIVRTDTIKAEVARYRKNLLNPKYLENVGFGYNLFGTNMGVKSSNGVIEYTAINDSNSRRLQVLLPIEEFVLGESYTFTLKSSFKPSGISIGYANNHNDTSTYSVFGKTNGRYDCPFTVTNVEKPYLDIYIYFQSMAVGDTGTMTDLQIELGTQTEYEPFTKETYTANADGTVEGVKSISPNMTLIPNNNAVTVECEYCKA